MPTEARRSLVPALLLVLGFAPLACSTTSGPLELAEPAPAEELYRQGLGILEGTHWLFYHYVDYDAAIQKFQDVIDNYPYSEYAVLSELKIADAYFDDERYEEALSYYQEFPELHPNHERVPYTILRAAECHYQRMHEANRDQVPTRKALEQLDVLLSRYPYSPEAERGEEMWRELRTRLGEHVMAIADFYMKRDEFQSAADRYRSVLNDFPGLGLDAEALYKLGVCYTNMNLEDEAERIFQVILDNYQGTDVADAAADLIPAAN